MSVQRRPVNAYIMIFVNSGFFFMVQKQLYNEPSHINIRNPHLSMYAYYVYSHKLQGVSTQTTSDRMDWWTLFCRKLTSENGRRKEQTRAECSFLRLVCANAFRTFVHAAFPLADYVPTRHPPSTINTRHN